MKKRVLSFALAVLMVVACVPAIALSSSAASTDISKDVTWYNGKTGEVAGYANDDNTGSYVDISYAVESGYTWSLSADGVLTVSGQGEMPNLATDEWPWHSYRSQITKAVVLFGLTSIGSHAFEDCDNMTEIVIPEGVTTLGNDAFAYNAGLKTITLPSTITTIKQGVVYSSPAIETVYIPGDPATFEEGKTIGSYNDALKTAGGKLVKQEYTQIEVSTRFGEPNPGWQNWDGANFETVLFVQIKDMNGNPVRDIPLDATWKLTFAASGSGKVELGVGKKTITLSPFRQIPGYEENYAFTPCLGEGENQFVPIKGVTYTLAIEVYGEDGALLYKSAPSTDGFKCGVDPKVPEGTYPTNLFLNPQCYIETNLGSPMPVDSVKVANYPQGTVYKWLVYATNDNTLPIDQWTIIGGKITDEKSTELSDYYYTAKMAYDEEGKYEKYQYIRIYGLYHSGNVGFHFNDVQMTVAVEGDSRIITWVVGDQTSTSIANVGEVPVYEGTPYKAPTYTKEYVFTGWDKEIVAATENTTYTAQFEERDRGARTIEIGYSWWNMENWNWGGVEQQTQLLISFKADNDPTFNQDNKINKNNFQNYRWEVTFIWEEDGVEKSSTHIMTPWSNIGSVPCDYRIRLTSGPDAFFPVKDMQYKIGLKLYDVTMEGYGPEGYLVYEGVSTKTVGLSADPMYNDAFVSADDICDITWKLEGETVYTTQVLKGITPSYPLPIAATKWADGKMYVLATDTEIVAATGDATYNLVYVQKTEISLDKVYEGWENWSEETQLLLKIFDHKGEGFKALWEVKDNFVWVLNIDGVDYEVTPASEYLDWNLYRFEVCKDSSFVPTAGANHVVSLTIYEADGTTVAYKSTNSVTTTVPEDFEPIVHSVKGDFNADGTVTIGDVTALLDMIAGKADFVAGTDLNNDGNTTIGDVTALLDKIAGK